MICMDIDYMQDYADFTVNKQRFPDLAALSAELKAQGIRLVPIIDAGVRIDPENPVCAEGLANGPGLLRSPRHGRRCRGSCALLG